jgi:hypothetical protein
VKSSSLRGLPSSETVISSKPTLSTRPSNTPTSSMTWPRVSAGAATVASSNSRSTASPGASSSMRTTLMSLSSCFSICSRGADSTSTTMVMRLSRSSSVGATASEKML